MKAVDNTVRRSWDKEEYEKKAKDRAEQEKDEEGQQLTARQKKYRALDPLHQGLITERSSLKREEVEKYRVDYGSQVGKKQVVSLVGDRAKQGGFYCKICDILMKDSLAYADHLNGKMHQRLLGMTMRTERATVSGVKDKFAALKRKREQKSNLDPDKAYEEKMARLIEEDEEKRRARRQAKLEKKANEREERDKQKLEEEEGVDQDVMAAMGFGGFGSGK